jgi:hypothetical protein
VRDNTEHTILRIEWIGGTSTEHDLRRTISCCQRLCGFPRMRRLVEPTVAAGQTSEQIAECLNREGFHPVSNRDDRFTPSRARELVYRLGLSPRCRPAEPLGPDEWWVRDLADKLGVSYHRFKDWVKKGYVHYRKVARRGNLVIWADAEERKRLGRLRDYPRPGRSNRYPDELTRPKDRSAPARGRKAKRSRGENDDSVDR